MKFLITHLLPPRPSLQMIKEIKAAVTIPVMAKARIGHFVEAQILEAVGIDYIDESEVSHQQRGRRDKEGGPGGAHCRMSSPKSPTQLAPAA